MSICAQRIVLLNRPNGAPGEQNFKLEEFLVPIPNKGEVLVETHFLSLDPYMRGRMDDATSYAAPVPIGKTMEGGIVGQVLESRSSKFQVGDFVFGQLGWLSHSCTSAKNLRKIDPSKTPITTALGVLGMPGFTGWYGLTKIARPKKGETLVVAAATGPVGSIVGQIAKSLGLRTIGIAGSPKKCQIAKDTFGFDHCINHNSFLDGKEIHKKLVELCPNGIDIYFENVAGKILDGILPLMNVGGRITICGMVSWYNSGALGANAQGVKDRLPKIWRSILVKRISVQGFIISDHWDSFREFIQDVQPLVIGKKLNYIENVVEGLENAPLELKGLLEGKNLGKMIIKVK